MQGTLTSLDLLPLKNFFLPLPNVNGDVLLEQQKDPQSSLTDAALFRNQQKDWSYSSPITL